MIKEGQAYDRHVLSNAAAEEGSNAPDAGGDSVTISRRRWCSRPLPDAALLNGELKRIILERERHDHGVQHSNLGGWQSGWDFEEASPPGACSRPRASWRRA